jgi:hypothetical protein
MLYSAILFGLLIFSFLVLFVMFSALVAILKGGVPLVNTSKTDLEFIVKQFNISPADTFYDLGSGYGSTVFFVNKISGAKCVGFELALWAHLLAKIKLKIINLSHPPLQQRGGDLVPPSFLKRGLGGVQFKNQNFFQASWSEANYVYGYLFPPLMAKVEEKFLSDCKAGTTTIIRDFPFPNLKPDLVFKRPNAHCFYIYKKV